VQDGELWSFDAAACHQQSFFTSLRRHKELQEDVMHAQKLPHSRAAVTNTIFRQFAHRQQSVDFRARLFSAHMHARIYIFVAFFADKEIIARANVKHSFSTILLNLY
jgi:hypothetical protein